MLAAWFLAERELGRTRMGGIPPDSPIKTATGRFFIGESGSR